MTRAILLPLLAGLLLASCTAPIPGSMNAAQLQNLVGRSQNDAILLLGVPTRTAQAGDTTFLQWDQSQQTSYPPMWGYGWGPPGYGGVPPVVVQQTCQTTLQVQNGKVVTWAQRGNAC